MPKNISGGNSIWTLAENKNVVTALMVLDLPWAQLDFSAVPRA